MILKTGSCLGQRVEVTKSVWPPAKIKNDFRATMTEQFLRDLRYTSSLMRSDLRAINAIGYRSNISIDFDSY